MYASNVCDSSKFCELSLTELKKELSKRGAWTTGRKAELLERLQAYERNKNFNGSEQNFLPPIPFQFFIEGPFKSLTLKHRNLLPRTIVPSVKEYFVFHQANSSSDDAVLCCCMNIFS